MADGAARCSMTEVSPGDTVATLVRPAGPAVGGVVWAHGGSDDGRRFFLDEARELAAAGLAVLLPVTRLPPHGDAAKSEAAMDRAVRNFRGGLDLLSDHAGSDRLCFFGHSAGGALGSLLAAVDPRLSRVILAGTGSGTIVRLARAELTRTNHPARETYPAFLDRFDPRRHISRYSGALLVQHGLRDDVVTTEEARRLYNAAGPSAQWATYDHGHSLDSPAARQDRRAFLLETEPT